MGKFCLDVDVRSFDGWENYNVSVGRTGMFTIRNTRTNIVKKVRPDYEVGEMIDTDEIALLTAYAFDRDNCPHHEILQGCSVFENEYGIADGIDSTVNWIKPAKESMMLIGQSLLKYTPSRISANKLSDDFRFIGLIPRMEKVDFGEGSFSVRLYAVFEGEELRIQRLSELTKYDQCAKIKIKTNQLYIFTGFETTVYCGSLGITRGSKPRMSYTASDPSKSLIRCSFPFVSFNTYNSNKLNNSEVWDEILNFNHNETASSVESEDPRVTLEQGDDCSPDDLEDNDFNDDSDEMWRE